MVTLVQEVEMAQVLEEILAAHADDLNQGTDTTERLVTQYAVLFPELPTLLYLGKLLKRALAPVKPRASFVRQLKQQLLYNLPAETAPTPPAARMMLVGAVVGSTLSLAGVVLLLVRRARLLARRAAPVTPTI